MSTALWLAALALSAGLAYSIVFSEVTLALGRTLSAAGPVGAYQAALTPPWQARLSVLVYVLTLTVVVISGYEFGVGRGCATVLGLVAGSLAWRRVLPQGYSTHYLKLIVISMARRYADWVRCGDSVRAAAMAALIIRMGFELPGLPRRRETSA